MSKKKSLYKPKEGNVKKLDKFIENNKEFSESMIRMSRILKEK